MPITRTALAPLLSLSLLTACASDPSPNHQFYTESGPNGLHFTLVHYSESEADAERGPAPAQAENGKGSHRGGKGGGRRVSEQERGGQSRTAKDTVPKGAIDDRTLMALLEQELDQRQLCLEGYRIIEQRPTQHGVVLQGHCL
ncbi:hypothetical protein [Ferrimonas balearica]|uniref:hypothetical protein n=1 Tax=Ferrimonas balearica TaxID=44012 RepID=UPI001C9922DE|nr:hypothetical protein [Ferrimonas balearica]MBY5992536.1 hypothetical protein [Ferrimonas balearica]